MDKSRSGPDLCEPFGKSVIGDYYVKIKPISVCFYSFGRGENQSDKNWVINGVKVNLSELENALTQHWLSISPKYPKIKDVKII
ncbi:hypothetical protein J4734_26580 [Klebsiella pneumoniae]|uniref:Uncharacterized protein n=1 Tax=Klebsiella pneumoniae TaxID=573 RepID=A0A939SQH3_KLEPN|nr:hypothetical protein [Klebsiella pneumoniae]